MNLFNIQNQEIGDILLISNSAVSSSANRKMQAAAHSIKSGSLVKAKYSHAILALQKGTFFESMYYGANQEHNGVAYLCYDELLERLNTTYKNNWKVIRYTNLSENQKSEIHQRCIYYNKQNYNKNFITIKQTGQQKYDSSFCSELIGKIFFDIGITIHHGDIWPIHLDKLTDNKEWEVVSYKYKKDCNEHFDIDFFLDMCLEMKVRHNMISDSYDTYRSMINNINKSFDDTRELIDDVLNNPQQYKDNAYAISKNKTFYSAYIKDFISLVKGELSTKHINKIEASWMLKGVNIQPFTEEEVYTLLQQNIDQGVRIYVGLTTSISNFMKLITKSETEAIKASSLINNILQNEIPNYKENDLIESYIRISDLKTNDSNYLETIERIQIMLGFAHRIHFIKDKNILPHTLEDIEKFILGIGQYVSLTEIIDNNKI